jgi:small subunit ribosomal protein S1
MEVVGNMETVIDLAKRKAFAIQSLKEFEKFDRFVTVEVVGIEPLTFRNQTIECLKVYYDGVYGYVPKDKIDEYDFYSIESFVNTEFEVMVSHVIEDEHQTYFIGNRIEALNKQADIFWRRGKKGDIVQAFVSGVDAVNVYLLVNGIRVRLHKEDYSYKYIRDIRLNVERGQIIDVKITEFNSEKKEIKVSRRILEAEPKVFLTEYSVGGTYGAIINNINPNVGVFVSLKPHGISALAALPPSRIGEHLEEGSLVNLKISRMDLDKGYIYGRIILPKAGLIGQAHRNQKGKSIK